MDKVYIYLKRYKVKQNLVLNRIGIKIKHFKLSWFPFKGDIQCPFYHKLIWLWLTCFEYLFLQMLVSQLPPLSSLRSIRA